MLPAIIASAKRRYRAAVLADSPVAYWRLGEASGTTAVDEMGSYPGTYVGGFTSVAGVLTDGNTAVTFNGSTQYINLGTSVGAALNGAAAVTIESLAKFASLPAGAANFIFGTRVNSVLGGIEVYTNGSTIVAAGRSQAADSYQSKSFAFSTTATWVHIVSVIDFAADTIQIYLNGVAQIGSPGVTFGASVYTRGTPTQTDRVASSPAELYFFNGSLDEVSIYPTALSTARIISHYQAARPPA